MKKTCIIISLVSITGTMFAQKKPVTVEKKPVTVEKAPVIKNRIDSVSYLVGASIAGNLMTEMSEGNIDLIVQGIKDGWEKKALACNDNGGMYLNDYFQGKNAAKQAEEEKMNEKYKILGENFLKDNVRNLGVVVTESGLQYKILGETDGPKPSATSKVKVHYHGTTIEGKVFDSSVDRGEPIEFPLNQVIPGWTEGLQLMSVGSKFKFFIPQNLAYGAQSPSPAIAPYSTLIFEVELLSFEDTPKN